MRGMKHVVVCCNRIIISTPHFLVDFPVSAHPIVFDSSRIRRHVSRFGSCAFKQMITATC